MKVIEKTLVKDVTGICAWYKFDTGHEYRISGFHVEFGYTKSGNYTSQITLRKLSRLASEYEDKRIQVPN
jgi:hypothetical protein